MMDAQRESEHRSTATTRSIIRAALPSRACEVASGSNHCAPPHYRWATLVKRALKGGK